MCLYAKCVYMNGYETFRHPDCEGGGLLESVNGHHHAQVAPACHMRHVFFASCTLTNLPSCICPLRHAHAQMSSALCMSTCLGLGAALLEEILWSLNIASCTFQLSHFLHTFARELAKVYATAEHMLMQQLSTCQTRKHRHT
jgi:hypothetical protein